MIHLLFETARMTCYFAGMVMMLIAIVYFCKQWARSYSLFGIPHNPGAANRFLHTAFWPRQESRMMYMESLHRRSFAASLCAIGAFSVPLLFDLNALLGEPRNHPFMAFMAVHALLFIQISLVRSMSKRPLMATFNFVGFYVFSMILVMASDAGVV